MTREQLNDFIDERIYPNSENEITAAKHNAVDKALADYAEDYADEQVASEAGNRDAAISAAIAGEVSNRNSAIASAIASEVSARNSAINTAIAQEVNDRNSAIGTAISTEVSNRNAAIDAAVLAARQTRYSAFGAVYDSGTWKMHNVGGTYLVTGLTAADMEKICASPDFTTGVIFAGTMRKGEKTNRPVDIYRVVRGSSIIVDMRQMARGNTSLQVFYIPVSGEYAYAVNDMIAAFMGCSALRMVKYLDVSRCNSFDKTFDDCTVLVECYLKGVDADLDLGAATNLTRDSLIYIVENAGTAAKSLTFTAGLKSGWSTNPPESYPTWDYFVTYAASKNISFNTV